LIAHPLRAQTTASGSLRGTATDPQGAVLPGVSISVSSATVPGIRTSTTDQRGEFRVPDLPPGEYTLTAELDGFSRFMRTPIVINAGLNVTLDIAMSVGAITETVQVNQEAPLLESSKASQAVNISGEMLRGIPLSERREWFGAFMLTPGVTTAQWVNNEVLMYVHGADSSANIIQIDGADVSPSLMSGVRYVSLNIDSIDDIQIKTAGIDASAPLGVGGIVNIASASGTNQLKGTGTVFVQPRGFHRRPVRMIQVEPLPIVLMPPSCASPSVGPVIRTPSALTGAAVVAFAGKAPFILRKCGHGERQAQYRTRQDRGLFQPSFHENLPNRLPSCASAVSRSITSASIGGCNASRPCSSTRPASIRDQHGNDLRRQ